MGVIPLQAGDEPFPGYHLRELRGRGGYAQVWSAEAADGSWMALKFLSGLDAKASPREIRAIQTVRQLRHPNLIQVQQVWTYKSYIVVSMELAEGSLLDLLEAHQTEFGKPVPAQQVCFYLSQAAEALD